MKKLLQAKTLLLLGLLIIIVLILSLGQFKKNPNQKTLVINNKIKINVEIADTPAELTQGYSNHPPISDQEGMLFILPNAAKYNFWMKDMLFDLDFIYIRNKRIVELVENVPAPANYQGKNYIVYPKQAFRQVLEVKSGFIKKNKMKLNDSIELID